MALQSRSEPIPPFPRWRRTTYRLPRPVTEEDIAAFVQDQELYSRETAAGEIWIVHKFGIAEIHCIVGERTIEVWFAPEKSAAALAYIDALLSTQF